MECFEPQPLQDAPQKRGITFKTYAEKWLALYKAPKLEPTTLRGYRSTLNTHFLPAFGKKPIDRITTDAVQKYLNERKDLARKTLHTQLMVLGEIFADAMEDGHDQKNPTQSRKLTIPSTKRAERNALLPEQVLDVIGQIGNLEGTEKRLMALILLTGVRRGEVLGLKWEDIDSEEGLIRIVRNVTYPYSQPTIGTPKSKQGIRTVPLDKQLWEMRQPVEEGYIIGSDVPITRMVLTRMWNRIEKKVNLYGATPTGIKFEERRE